ncbi:MAG: type III-B CRISPR-associated protein Cas10/Cmr2 [Candidatus Competibacteraceae bacterium]|nr:type III-B CRISPR-associated protein Cas10/Cmr2 [Candidatus Competibacteraceae bacterium]MCB1803808.1 type III-B CRISPR-associated protein Cas10/Cmr2 [Candidatus Competibacteraceae bacterium]MCB1813249.1 type III-B CRISPR-associated protein Cas10/Cmr2 [Candidatus Competibacteraceae bacterium]
MSEQKHFQFTLGPVQGFVAQARRTRDFWAGSFILSWLSGVAMRAVQAQDGTIIFPVPGQDYLSWIDGSQKKNSGPQQGGVPNRFLAKVPDDFRPQEIVNSVNTAWRALADAVWQADLAQHAAAFPAMRPIWDRQIDNFWEMSWVFGDASNLLDRRKNWRSHQSPAEQGVKCMVMEGWQELSGVPGPLKPEVLQLEQFWQLLRETGQKGMQTDLAENEHLCAIAFVKRRFARYFETVQASMPNGWTVQGWKLPTGVPSVQYLAAVHWLVQVIKSADAEQIDAFCEQAEKIGERGEWDTRIAAVERAIKDSDKPNAKRLAKLDGGLFFRTLLENKRLYSDENAAKRVVQALARLAKDPPTPFYAVLLMDGDSLGVHMGDAAKRPNISKALEQFTGEVQAIVEQHNGFLIYAGGDDVLALLPLEDALICAVALRQRYLRAFAPYQDIPSTLSGAIEFAHVKMPLTRVLQDSHTLLDDVAKDGRGRDAIAVRVWKPGGQTLTWAMPWQCALVDSIGSKFVIDKLVKRLQEEEERQNEPGFSNKFLYKVRERFALLNPRWSHRANSPPDIFNEDQALTLLAVDYLASGVNQGRKPKMTMTEAKQHIQPLLEQCRPVFRDKDKPPQQWQRSTRLEEDGALLVRFLVQKGVER